MTKNYCLAILYNNRTEGREGSCVFFGIFLSLSFAPFCYWRRKLQRLEMNSAALKRKMETQYNNTSQISSITGGWTQLGDSKVLAPGDFHVHKSRVCAAVHCTQQTPVELKPAPSGGSSSAPVTPQWSQYRLTEQLQLPRPHSVTVTSSNEERFQYSGNNIQTLILSEKGLRGLC